MTMPLNEQVVSPRKNHRTTILFGVAIVLFGGYALWSYYTAILCGHVSKAVVLSYNNLSADMLS